MQENIRKTDEELINNKSCSVCIHFNKGNRGVCITETFCNNKDNWQLDVERLNRLRIIGVIENERIEC